MREKEDEKNVHVRIRYDRPSEEEQGKFVAATDDAVSGRDMLQSGVNAAGTMAIVRRSVKARPNRKVKIDCGQTENTNLTDDLKSSGISLEGLTKGQQPLLVTYKRSSRHKTNRAVHTMRRLIASTRDDHAVQRMLHARKHSI